ncbi:hypothetical protein JCM17823_00870 [Halorubrum gandharaense]
MSRLSTGVPVLDRRLGGGLPPGSLAALVAPPESQSELFLRALCDTTEAVYLTTLRPAVEVERQLADAGVENVSVRSCDPQTLTTEPDRLLADIPEDGVVVVDPFNPVETVDRTRHVGVLDALKSGLEAAGAVGMVHCLVDDADGAGRTRTLARSDLVCEVDIVKTSLSIDTRLYVTKFRGGSALTEPVKVKLTDTVSVDTSRDIA